MLDTARWRAIAVTVLVAAGAALAAIASVAQAHSTNEQAAGQIKIGVEMALTGNGATLGTNALKGILFTVGRINARGGLTVGGKRYKLKLVVRDDSSNAETARAVVQRLITEDKVDVIIGGVISTVVGPSLLVAERYGVPVVTTFAYSSKVLPNNPKYSFVNVMSTGDQFTTPLSFVRSQGGKSVLVVVTNDELGQSTADALKALLPRYGLTSAGVERIDANTTDFASTMARIKNVKADALIVEAGSPTSYNFRIAQTRYNACNFKVSHYEYGPTLVPDWVDATRNAAVGPVSQAFWWPTMQGGKDRWFGNNAGFVRDFTRVKGAAPVWATAQGVQSTELMALAIEKAGRVDRKAIAGAFLRLRGSTLYGPIKFSADHFNRGFLSNVLVIQQQKPGVAGTRIVAPAGQAQVKYAPDKC